MIGYDTSKGGKQKQEKTRKDSRNIIIGKPCYGYQLARGFVQIGNGGGEIDFYANL
jgi:hypothetical protein